MKFIREFLLLVGITILMYTSYKYFFRDILPTTMDILIVLSIFILYNAREGSSKT
jgi:hypothetical protein